MCLIGLNAGQPVFRSPLRPKDELAEAPMKILFSVLLCSLILLGGLIYLRGYRSAFEADKQCHFDKFAEYKDSAEYGCDHDLETRQWILFRIGDENAPATVLKRYRY